MLTMRRFCLSGVGTYRAEYVSRDCRRRSNHFAATGTVCLAWVLARVVVARLPVHISRTDRNNNNNNHVGRVDDSRKR